MEDESAVSVAISSASWNIVLQVLVRILSSLSNAIIFRFISKQALGVINVRLLLLYSTCHCLSREAFRRSCLSKFNKHSLQKKFNLLWLIVPVCLLCCLLLRYIWLYVLEAPDPSDVSHYSIGVYSVLLSVLIESLAEPIYVFSQSSHFVKLKVVTEGLMLTVRSVSMVICLSKWPEHPMFCFSFSQILSSVIYTITFYAYFGYYLYSTKKENPLLVSSLWNTLPKFSKYFVNLEDLCLTWSFFKQTLLKQLLTEGERYLMTFFTLLSFADQGLYDVINNLGSLAARFVFLPIEDSAYLMFTHLMPRDSSNPKSQKGTSACAQVLKNILKLMFLTGVTILAFGYSYSQLLLYFYGGTKLSAGLGLRLMRWHCVYVLLLAINGVSEGFKFAVMNHSQIDRYNKNLIFLSVIFLSVAYCLVHFLGSVGFIMANCINMSFRIIHSMNFITNYFQEPKSWWRNIFPHPVVIGVLFIIFLSTACSEIFLCCDSIQWWILHLLVGAVCFCVHIFTVMKHEKKLIYFIYEHWKNKGSFETKSKQS